MKYTKIPNTTFQEIQLNAGILCASFDPATGTASDLLGATTGGINFTATPEYSDFGDDIDNCPKNTKELKHLDSWTAELSGDFVTLTHALAKMLVASADVDGVNSNLIVPRNDLSQTDFADLWLVADYSDKNNDLDGGYCAIHLINALSTGGFQIQTTDRAKGQFAFTFTGHYSIAAQSVVPFEVYVKAGTEGSGVIISRNAATIKVGDTLALTATTYPTTETITWDSSDDDVATVSSGTVTAVAAGHAIISASATISTVAYDAICTVTVVPAS